METKQITYNDIPSELFEKLLIEDALNRLGFFESSESGLPKRSWGPIEVIAGPWIPHWKLIITIKQNNDRNIYLPQELAIGLNMRPIDILAIIYCACDSFFRKEDPPKELMWGKMEWDRYNKEQREEYERRPKVRAEKSFFRFCISYIEKKYDWPNEDFDVEFSHADGQLKIMAKDIVVFCPAIGTFNGTLTISARQLIRRLPKRFVSPTVFIEVIKEDKVIISSHMFPAKWIEKSASPKFAVKKDLIGIVPIPQNSEKLNQESKNALLALKQNPDETGLYCLQLAEWSLKNRLEDPDGRLTTTLKEMKGWKHQNVMLFLCRNQDTKEEEDPVPWDKVKDDPKELADQIVLTIHDKLATMPTLQCYPRRPLKVLQ